jgi:osmotically-inducible protein OsmY
MRIIAILALSLAMAPTAWPAGPPAAAPNRKPAAAAMPSLKQVPDAVVEANIRARLLRSPKLRAEGFTVKVQGGVATIEGKTKVIQRKGAATRMAKLGGARAVDNKIQVDEAALAKAASNLEKGRRRAQVKRGEVRTEPAGAMSKR